MSAPALALVVLAAAGEPKGFAETELVVPQNGSRLAFRDLDGDGAAELLWIDPAGVGVRFLGADGRFSERDDLRLPWPGDDLAWDVGDVDGDGAEEVLLLEAGRTLRAFGVAPPAEGAERAFAPPRTVLEDAGGRLPRGRRHVTFARDVDGDGRLDLVVPGSGSYRIFLAGAEGFAAPIEVGFEAEISYSTGDPERVDGELGMELSIPWFSLEDVDGDGRTDLVSETDDAVAFHLASPELPAAPTWRLDKAALSEGAKGPRDLDFEDLFALLEGNVAWRIADLDGVPPRDLIVQQGSTFKVWLGGARRGDAGTPDDVLKSSGHVLTFLLHDLTGDGRPELLMIRAEKLSLGRVIRWLVLPGSLDFDVFAYENQGKGFGKRPLRRVVLRLRIPRLFSFFDELEGMGEELEARLAIPATVGSFDGGPAADDVVDLVDGRLVVFRDCAPAERGIDWRDIESVDFEEVVERFLLERIEGLQEGEARDIDLAKIKDIDLSPADELRSACAGKEPWLTHPLATEASSVALVVVDVDGDGLSDVVALDHADGEAGRRVRILVAR